MNEATKTNQSVRVRFAPSPTGHLHVGGLRTALFNFLFARHNNGLFLVRIEDTDTERSLDTYRDSIMSSLEWAQLMPDEPIVIQSARIAEHKKILQQLVDAGKAYRCYCTQEEIEARCIKTMHEHDGSFFAYDGHCATRIDMPEKPYVVRFKVPRDSETFIFDDIIRERISFDISYYDDFIIARSDGTPMYNFVVVADDHFMRITHVIRGEEHIANTPKQILLYQACGYAVPQFAHLPMILGPDGSKLSKRTGAVSVIEYQKEGFLPEALENYLVRLGWSHGDQELFTRQEMINYFTLDNVGKKGAIFDTQKLAWVNSVYLRKLTTEQIIVYIQKYIAPTFTTLVTWQPEVMHVAVELYKERVKNLKELADALILLHNGPTHYTLEGPATESTLAIVRDLSAALESVATIHADTSKQLLTDVAHKHTVPFVHVAKLMRLALIGISTGPSVSDMMAFLGSSKIVSRLQALVNYLSKML